MNPTSTQQRSTPNPPAFSWRGAISILTLVVGAILLGCLLSPPLFNWLTALGRNNAQLNELLGLRDLEFDSVTTRLILILVVLGLWPAIRIGRIPRIRFGDRAFFPPGLAFGLVSMTLLMGLGFVLGAYNFELDPELRRVSEWLEMILGALIIGVLEEFLFRGLVFKTLRRATRFWPAAAIGSAFFAIVHFAKPEQLVGTVFGHRDSGLQLAESMFYMGHEAWHYFPFMLTLFVMGLVLCRVVERTGSIWYAIGLHAGWVFAMRLGGYLVEADKEASFAWLYGPSDVIGKSYAALLLLIVFLIWWGLPSPNDGVTVAEEAPPPKPSFEFAGGLPEALEGEPRPPQEK